jgi:hypothetical protein
MKDLLKEAIADAKAVRETALANAKLALEEAFTPRLQSMLSAKLAEEMSEEDEEMPAEEEMPTEGEDMEDEGMPAEEPVEEGEGEEMPEEEMTEEEDMDMEGEGEDDLDLESIIRELEGDEEPAMEEPAMEEGTVVIEKLQVSPMEIGVDHDEAEGLTDAVRQKHKLTKVKSVNSDNGKVDIYKVGTTNFILADESGMGVMFKAADMNKIVSAINDGSYFEYPDMQEGAEMSDDEDINIEEIIKSLREEDESEEMEEPAEEESSEDLEEAYNVIRFLKGKINEVNLLNAKLLYSNKLFRNFTLSEGQKMKVIENFDRAFTLREVKLVYSTLAEGFKMPSTKRVVKESFASKPVASTKPAKQVISEGTELANRFKKLAGLK